MLRTLLLPLALVLTTPALAAAPDLPSSASRAERQEVSGKRDGGGSSHRSRGGARPSRGGSGGTSRGSGGSGGSGGSHDSGGSGGSSGSRDSGGSSGSRDFAPPPQGSSSSSRDSAPPPQGTRDGASRDGGPSSDRPSDPPADTRPSDARPADARSPGAPQGGVSGPDARSIERAGLQPAASGPGVAAPRPVRAGLPAHPGQGLVDGARALPANFRPPATAHAAPPPGGHSGAPPSGHASPPPHAAQTAAAHHQAAGAYGPHRAGPHAGAVAHQRAWGQHYRSAHPWRFWAYRRPAFVVWYPGYPHYWYHGVFVYGPSPTRAEAEVDQGPKRAVDREDRWSVGVRGGTYASGYTNGAHYSDFGLGIAARYRPVEPLGLEVQWTYHDQTWAEGTERIDQPLSASVELFAFPWSRFNPYVLGGVTYTNRNVQDSVGGAFVDNDHPVWGPHLGVGLELGVGKSWSVNADIRGIGYLNDGGEDLVRHGATQANLGVNVYF